MSSVTRSTSTSNLNRSSSAGLSGLVSGMDTESMVKKMISGTQFKIDKQNQNKQRLTWKQEVYRDVVSSLNTFKSKYLSFGSSSKVNLNSTTFFSSASTSVSSDAVSATALPNASTGKVTIDSITELASSRTIKANDNITAELSGTLDLESLKAQKITLQIGDIKKTFDIEGLTKDDIAAKLSAAFADPTTGFGPGKLSAEFDSSGKFIIKRLDTTDTDKNLFITGSGRALNILGMTEGEKPNGVAVGSVDFNKANDPLYINATLDGITKKIELNYNSASDADFATSLNKSLQDAFGDCITATYDSSSDKISFNTTGNRQFAIAGNTETVASMGFVSGQSNKINVATKLSDLKFKSLVGINTSDVSDGFIKSSDYEFSINGVKITGKTSESLSTVLNKINFSGSGVKVSYSALEDKFIMENTESGSGRDISLTDTKGSVLTALFSTEANRTNVEGQNAKLKIGGIDIERNSNVFELDGIKYDLKAKSDTPINISVSKDTEKITTGIKDFITDYNGLIDKLNGLLKEETTCSQYAPLTDSQKNEMTDKEIELWEKKAKSGLVHGDSDISSFISQVRSALYTKPEGAKYALFDLGITTDSWKNNGKLVMEDPPKKLMKAIEENAQEVSKLFTDDAEGLSKKISNIIDTFARVSSSSPGIFVKTAGATGNVDTSSTIYNQMKDIKERLSNLNTQYKKEYNRYWKQFNSMEKMIAQMNQQSSWLSSQ